MPILIDETYEPIEEFKFSPAMFEAKRKGGHLIVLVHGFLGSSIDLRLMKNIVSWKNPELQFLCSVDNESSTEGDIQYMGEKLAKEVKMYVKEWFPNNTLGKLSFIGHSLGGVIIRAALPLLEEYKQSMHTYLSLSTPHLGCMFGNSTLVDTGMWIIKKWKKSRCLEQLSMSDEKESNNMFMYRLSQAIVFLTITK